MNFKIGIITASDRGSRGEYDYLSGQEVAKVMDEFIATPFEYVHKVIPDEVEQLEKGLLELSDDEGCQLIITSGGTGPAPRDVTPEATEKVIHKLLPGYGEIMRMHGRRYVKTSILSRQIAGIRNNSLIINMPGKPSSIRECMEVIADVIPTTLKLIGNDKIELKEGRPKILD